MRENIRTAVLKYGPNEIRVRTSKLRSEYFLVWIELIGQLELYCIAIIKDQRPKPSRSSELNIFVSSLNGAVGRDFFFDSSISIT